MSRRILATRDAGWTKALAHRLALARVRPNAVSLASVGFAACAAAAFCLAPAASPGIRAAAFLIAAAAIQLRLLCNLLDGMLAVEEGLKSSYGEIFNELPDRVSDVLILVSAGASIRPLAYGAALGWAAAVAAVLTAYVRLLGGTLGASQSFAGPMAKQHRMFTLTVAAVISAAEVANGLSPRSMHAGLALIVAGSIVTIWRRTRLIVAAVKTR
jgi:phosphatidylglycerophosphate synthase